MLAFMETLRSHRDFVTAVYISSQSLSWLLGGFQDMVLSEEEKAWCLPEAR